MKSSIKNSTKCFCLILPTVLAILVWTVGCAGLVHHPDPLVGWQIDFNEQPNQAVVNDYQNYIKQLPPQERQLATVDEWLKDGTGQHAIKITIGLNHKNWRHILIYDKNNRRIKTIKYISGNSAS